ncbi:hypothetical protein [Caulobacter sp. 1776]|uniref:hypothetical protein n=1 Tax=Caulobacter sp. 1776 TaxID=3156420 RepID=UPI0033998E16
MILTRRSTLGALGATTALAGTSALAAGFKLPEAVLSTKADGEHTLVHAGSALVVRGGALVRA